MQRDALETLPDRPVEVCADLHLDPYYGDENDTEALYSSQAKRGTTTFHAYATLCARVRNKRYTLAVRQLVAGDTTSDILAEFLKLLDGLDVAGEVTFPVFIDCVYQKRRYDEHGVACHGYAADAPFIDTPQDAREHYSKRFGIELSYRLANQSLAFNSSQDAGLRLVMFVVSLLLQNSWRYLHWKYVAAPRRGGSRLWNWSFTEFCEMRLRAAWTVLGVRRAVPASRRPVLPVAVHRSGQRS